MSNLQAANDHIARIADVPECDLFEEERYLLAVHDERNRLCAENAALQARVAGHERTQEPLAIRAEKAEADNAALRAALDPERIIAEIGLPGGYYYDPQAIADAIRVYCRAALAWPKPNTKVAQEPQAPCA